MNALSFLPAGIKSICLLCCACTILLTASGCSWFGTTETPVADPGKNIVPEETDPISARRHKVRTKSKTFVCLIAPVDKVHAVFDPEKNEWTGIEPEIIRAIAAQLKMKVQFVEVPAAALSAALRNGRGDIAAGTFHTDAIAALNMAPVVAYEPAINGNYAFMVRPGDPEWKKNVDAAAEKVDCKKIVERYSVSFLKKASVVIPDQPEKSADAPPDLTVTVNAAAQKQPPAAPPTANKQVRQDVKQKVAPAAKQIKQDIKPKAPPKNKQVKVGDSKK